MRIRRAAARARQFAVELDELTLPIDLVGLPRDLRAQLWRVNVLEGELALAPAHNRGVVVGGEAAGASEQRLDGLPGLRALLAARVEVGAGRLRIDVVVAPECSSPLCDRERLRVNLFVDEPLSTKPADSKVVVSKTTTFAVVDVKQEGGRPEVQHCRFVTRQRARSC